MSPPPLCRICRKADPYTTRTNNFVLVCDGPACQRAYHPRCHVPPISETEMTTILTAFLIANAQVKPPWLCGMCAPRDGSSARPISIDDDEVEVPPPRRAPARSSDVIDLTLSDSPPQRPKRKTKPAPEIIDIIDSDDELEPASALPTPVARRSELPGIEPGRRSLSPLFTPSASVAPSALFTPSASVEPLFAPSPSVEPLFTPSPSVEPLFTPSPSVEPLFTPLASAAPLPLIADDEDENDKTEAKHVDPLHNPPTFPRLDQFRAYRDASASPASTSASPAPTPDLFFNGRSQSSASLSGSDIASPMEVDEDVKIPLAELERLRLAPAPKPKPRSQNPALARLGPAWIQSRVEANEWLKSYVAKQAAPKPLSKRKPGVGATRERVSGASFTLVHYHVYP